MKSIRKKLKYYLGGGAILILLFMFVGQAAAQTWIELFPTGGPPNERNSHSAIYDPATNGMIVFGGDPSIGYCYQRTNDVWVLENANGVEGTPNWIQLSPTGALPTIRDAHTAIYNPAADGMTVFGGRTYDFGLNDIWVLTNATGNAGQASDEFPIATTTGEEMAVNAAFDGTNYLVGIQGDANDNDKNNITAQLVSQSGTLIGPRITTGRTGGAPRVAFDGTNYLLVWEDDGTGPNLHLYGQRVSKSGQLVGSPFPINQAAGVQELYAIHTLIFDGVNYFVVWEYRSNPDSGDTADIYGQFVTPSGALLGSAIPVSTAMHGQRIPALTFDGTNILVVWVDGRNQSACYTDSPGTHCYESDIYGQFITKSSSSSAGTLFGTNFVINTSTLPRDNPPSIAFDGTNYLITFAEETTLPNACPLSGCKWDIYGQFVTKAGAPFGSKITISDTSPNHSFSGPVFNGTNYLITWTEGFGSTSATVKGRFFDKSGGPVGSEFTLFSPSGGRVPWAAVTLFNGSKYFSVINRGTPGTDPIDVDAYTNQDVYGAFIETQQVNETISTPSPPSGPTSGAPGTSYSYSTGGSSSNLGHSVQYFFDWGDGTNSGWLTVGQTSASKSWASAGTYSVRAQARCASHTSVVSSWSSAFSVTISQICTYTISPTSQSFGTEGGTGSVSVTAGSNCPWTASTNSGSWDWIGITSGWSGTGNGTVNYFVLANNSGNARTGTLTIAGQSFNVTQAGSTTDTVAPTNTTSANFINNGASSTSSTTVILSISATDNVGVTGYYAAETSTTPSATTSGWTSVTSTTSYSANVPFTLSSGDGTKTVYVWFKDAAGNVSASASYSIILSTTTFNNLEFPFKTPSDIERIAAFGIPNWSGFEPHNGIDLQTGIITKLISPTAGTITSIEIDENPFSNPPKQLMLTIGIRINSEWIVYLVLEPSTIDENLKNAQIKAVQVQVGQVVKSGDEIADLLVGNLGYPHLHYMVMRNNEFVCAYKYSSDAAKTIFNNIAATRPNNNLPDGNICYGQGSSGDISMTTPYVMSSDMASIHEGFSTSANCPWGFAHNGIDFFPTGNLKPFQAVSSGVVKEVRLWQNNTNWQVNVMIQYNSTYSVSYAFEPMSSVQADGETQLTNISVSLGQAVSQGDVIGRLYTVDPYAHVHFMLLKDWVGVCPEPYFTQEAKTSILGLIHKDHPDWNMCY